MKFRRLGVVSGAFLSIGLIGSITSCGGSAPSTASSGTLTVAPPLVNIVVSPSNTTVSTSLTTQFTATVTGSTNTAVTWSVNGTAGGNQTLGTISASGLYTAPSLVPTPAILTITATSVANPALSANAQVTIVTPIGIVLSPQELTLLPGQTQNLTASVTGPIASGVNWTVNGISGGNASVGTLATIHIDGSTFTGQYAAPNVPPAVDPVIVEAVSTVDPAAFATAQVAIRRDNQLPQPTPIKLGTSGGNASDLLINGTLRGCCSGTLGALLSRGGNFYILSNNHVLDKSDLASAGDPIVQPGLGDVNCQAQNTATVAHLSQAAALHGAPNNVDAAIAAIVPGAVDTSGAILDLNGPNQPAPPSSTLADGQTVFSSKEPVAKVGRSSGLTCSTITAVGADIVVNYETSCGSSSSFQVNYTNQIVIVGDSFSEAGDSGSLVVTADTARPIGLLYAGNGSSTTVNPMADVLSALKDPSSGEVPKVVGAADHAVGCPATGQSVLNDSAQTAYQPQLDAKALQRAQLAKTQYEIRLMQNSVVSGISVGGSDDDPGQPAVIVHVKASPQTLIPHEVGGVRTKVLFDQPTASLALSNTAIASAMQVKNKHSAELLSNFKVFGVGVGASKDSPGEAAIVIYVDRASILALPVEIDGTRTEIVHADPFRTAGWGREVPASCSRAGNSERHKLLLKDVIAR